MRNATRFGAAPTDEEILAAVDEWTDALARGDYRAAYDLTEHDPADDPRALDCTKWLGLNLLGKALTQVRDALLAESEKEPADSLNSSTTFKV